MSRSVYKVHLILRDLLRVIKEKHVKNDFKVYNTKRKNKTIK